MLLAVCLSLGAPSSAADLPQPVTEADFRPFEPAQAALGRLLFYDKILSGNRDIACATCHHHDLATGDALSLGIGAGGQGLGRERTAGQGRGRILKRVPRNAPPLWNLGRKELSVLFWDGRLSRSDLYGNGFNSPAGTWLPIGLPDLLAAQALFPVAAPTEMAGRTHENEVARAAHKRIDLVWPILAARVRAIPAYGAAFVAAFDGVARAEDVTMVEIATALSAFMNAEWRSFDSPFDAYLAGDATALSSAARRGLGLFYGAAGCAGCHSGQFFTDQRFHALGVPQFGPGRTRPFDPYARDVGRMGDTDDLADAYRFRTPSLRNVALTAPYGHNGAYPTLEAMLRHHLDPLAARAAWRPEDARLPQADWLAPTDFVTLQDARERARIVAAIEIEPVALSDGQVADLLAFLHSLTGGDSVKGRLGKPRAVPSGLPVD